jgi:hypothetical protein
MSALLDRVNAGGVLHDAPIDATEPWYQPGPAQPMTCTPLMTAELNTENIVLDSPMAPTATGDPWVSGPDLADPQ